MDIEILKQKKRLFECHSCNYRSTHRGDYKKHLATNKHNILTNSLEKEEIKDDNSDNVCCCGRSFKHRQSLNNHKRKCFQNKIPNMDNMDSEEDIIDYKGMMKLLIKQNKDLMGHIGELVPKVGNNNNNNNIKQKFNINLFLNEECKDAITMDEFIDKIKITIENLMITKEKGIAEGVSNIFIENMNKLSLYERPIHCTDVKRETVYIKYNSINWEKDKENKKIKEALEKIGHVQRKALSSWVDANPNWENIPALQEEYMLLISSCMANLTENKNDNRVIKKICNNTFISGGAALPLNPL